jgi:hypothetical protein
LIRRKYPNASTAEDATGEDPEEVWDVSDPQLAWKVYRLSEGTEWHFLPEGGGLINQDEALMDDLVTIAWRKGILEERMKNAAVPYTEHEGQVKDHAGLLKHQHRDRPESSLEDY